MGRETLILDANSHPLITWKRTSLRFKPGKSLAMRIGQDNNGIWLAISKPYSIFTYSIKRESLINEIYEQIIFLWIEFVKHFDDNCSDAVKRLKDILEETFEELSKGNE